MLMHRDNSIELNHFPALTIGVLTSPTTVLTTTTTKQPTLPFGVGPMHGVQLNFNGRVAYFAQTI